MTTLDALSNFGGTVDRLGIVLRPDGSPQEVEGVLNPASAVARDGTLLIYPRAVAEGNVSRVGICRGVRGPGDELRFERLGFVLEPQAPYELRTAPGGNGCEDPRVTFVPVLDRYVMAYTAFGPDGPRIAVALSQDGYHWERLGLVRFAAGLDQGDDKDGVFFPEPVLSPAGVRSFALYHRPMLRLSTMDGRGAIPTLLDLPVEERESTRIAYIPLDAVLADVHNLLDVRESAVVLHPDMPWCRVKTGAGTPPVRIAEGWFSLFHGVNAREVSDGKYVAQYSAGFVVHDAERPHLVRYRSQQPVMVPEGVDETHGIVSNVVFPTAIDVRADRVFDVYYGMADARIGRARVRLNAPFAAEEEPAA
ncbi:MAG: glycosidase [Candidatus Eremiobacteraeota bacterium]|nr:glycosidase [Candidatus Eremiobacteraeota bacterium]